MQSSIINEISDRKIQCRQYSIGAVCLERIGVEALVTDNVEEITSADKVIFPGVGEASTAMKYLRERKLDTGYLKT